MSSEFTLDCIPKSRVYQEVKCNIDSLIAFDHSMMNTTRPCQKFPKTSLMGILLGFYRERNYPGEKEASYYEFSLFADETFAKGVIAYGETEFIKDYTSQEGYFELNEEECKEFYEHLAVFKLFVEQMDFSAYFLIMTYF